MQLGSLHFDESFTYILQREVQEKKNKTIYWRVRELVTLKRGGADNKRFEKAVVVYFLERGFNSFERLSVLKTK